MRGILDVVGIGIGPFNLGLAALLDGKEEVEAVFLERKGSFDWHPGMLIDGTTLQVPFLADLVSMVDVTNRHSFLNYLQEHGRLYHYYFLEKFHIPRKEYNHYCRWVAERLPSCRFSMEVEGVIPVDLPDGEKGYKVSAWDHGSGQEKHFMTRHVVMGIGSVPSIPDPCKEMLNDRIFHSSEYVFSKSCLKGKRSVTVIGSGQSAAEVFLDATRIQEEEGFSLNWFTRSDGFFPMEYSKLGLEHFSPDFTNFFYHLPQERKDELLKGQGLLYKGISAGTIADIYDLLYERSIGGVRPPIHLQAMTEITGIGQAGSRYVLEGFHHVKKEAFSMESDVIILGTGYKQAEPSFLSAMDQGIWRDSHGRFGITEDYRLRSASGEATDIFVQNGELHTHGVGAPDLGLGAHRNAIIINQIVGREVYPIRQKNVFQSFGIGDPSGQEDGSQETINSFERKDQKWTII